MQLSSTSIANPRATDVRQNEGKVTTANGVQFSSKVSVQSSAGSVQQENGTQRSLNNEKYSAQTGANKQSRLDINEQALAQVEQFKQQQDDTLSSKAFSSQNNANATDLSSINLASTIQTSSDQSRLGQDNANPSSKYVNNEQNLSAVSAYQSVGNLAQRESVQQLFGVDLYA